jgi:hypothetical protein
VVPALEMVFLPGEDDTSQPKTQSV